jgi:hypothetical protein
MLVKFCKQCEITSALDSSENGVMFEKSESADDNGSNNECDCKGIYMITGKSVLLCFFVNP